MTGETVTTENRARILPSSGLSTGDADQKSSFVNSTWVEAAKVEGTQVQSVAESGSTNTTKHEDVSTSEITGSESLIIQGSEQSIKEHIKTRANNLRNSDEFLNYIIESMSDDELEALVGDVANVPDGCEPEHVRAWYVAAIYLNNNIKRELVSSCPDEMLFNWARQQIEAGTDSFSRAIELFPQFKDNILKAFIDDGCDVNGFKEILDSLPENTDMDEAAFKNYVQLQILVKYADYSDFDALCAGEDDEDLSETLGLDSECSPEELENRLLKYLLSDCGSPEARVGKILKLLFISNEKMQTAEFNIVRDTLLMHYAEIIDNETGDSAVNYDTILKALLAIDKSELDRLQTIASADLSKLSQDAINDLAQQYFDGNATAEAIQQALDACNLSPERAKELIDNKDNTDFIDACTEDEKKFITEYYPVLMQAEGNVNTIISGSDLAEEEKTEGISNNTRSVYDNLGERAYRDVITATEEIFKQYQDVLNITPEQFAEIMNGATNGNYSIVVEDILRGDGVQTPLNMPEAVSGEGSVGETGNGGTSAQDQSTGFFSVPSQQIIQNTQNNVAQLSQNIAQASATDNSPKLVKPETETQIQKGNIDSILTSNDNDLVSAVKTYIQQEGIVNFVKDAFNSKNAMQNTYIRQKALNFFANVIPKATKLLTFDKGIHNSANAELAARTMSVEELNEVHAQNRYLAEKIEEIKEEKERQQGLV